MNYSIIYYRYYVLGIIQEYRFPPLHQPTPWGTRVFPNVWPCLAISLRVKVLYRENSYATFFVSWFQSFLVSNSQSFNEPILPKCHFMVFGEYWSHIQDSQEFIRRIVGMFRHPSFPNISKCSIAVFRDFQKSYFRNTIRDLFLDYLECPGVSKDKYYIGLGSHGHVQKSRNHANAGFHGSPLMKSKSY